MATILRLFLLISCIYMNAQPATGNLFITYRDGDSWKVSEDTDGKQSIGVYILEYARSLSPKYDLYLEGGKIRKYKSITGINHPAIEFFYTNQGGNDPVKLSIDDLKGHSLSVEEILYKVDVTDFLNFLKNFANVYIVKLDSSNSKSVTGKKVSFSLLPRL